MEVSKELVDFFLSDETNQKYVQGFYKGDLFHYTSPEGMNSILFSNSDNIELFASRYDCVNDINEGNYALSIYRKVLKNLNDQKKITDEQFLSIKDVIIHNQYSTYRRENNTMKREYVEHDNYICCFSTDCDSLPMWNYYSKNSKYQGYNIKITGADAINKNITNKHHGEVYTRWYTVLYDEQKQIEIIENFLLELMKYYNHEKNKDVFYVIASMQLTKWSMFFKSPYFCHENEIRVVISIPKDIKTDDFPVLYRQKDMFIIPYIKLKIDKSCISGVTISPLYCTDDEKQHQIDILSEWLRKENYKSCDVKISKIPIRY